LAYWKSFSDYLLHIKMVYKFIRPIQYIYRIHKLFMSWPNMFMEYIFMTDPTYLWQTHIYSWPNIFMTDPTYLWQTQHIYGWPNIFMTDPTYLCRLNIFMADQTYLWLTQHIYNRLNIFIGYILYIKRRRGINYVRLHKLINKSFCRVLISWWLHLLK